MGEYTLLQGDAFAQLKTLPDQSVQCVVTSPPYWGLRDYGVEGQLGLEPHPQQYVEKMVEIFGEVRRVLKDDGTLWLNLGDSFVGSTSRMDYPPEPGHTREDDGRVKTKAKGEQLRSATIKGLKRKELVGMPWRVALALREPYAAPMCIKQDVDRAWLAAMFDGEGCIGIRRFSSYRKEKQQVYQDGFVAYTSIGNTDIELLDRCVEITGFGKVGIKSKAGYTDKRGVITRRDCYGWRLDSNAAMDVIRAIYKYLIAKRKQACLAYTLDCLNKYGHGSRSVPQEVQEKKVLLKEIINKCNQRKPVDIPSWVEEPQEKIVPGWYLRSDIIYSKTNPMPESVTDRPTRSHEFIFLMTKKEKYFYNSKSIREPSGRNKTSVWHLATQPFPGMHFAVFPEKLIEPCVLAGSRWGDTILDPFSGAGTTGVVAIKHGRKYIGIELNPEYAKMSDDRIGDVAKYHAIMPPLFAK